MEMIKAYQPEILAVLETRIHSSQVIQFLNNTGFTDMLVVESLGYVGGIWLLWHIEKVSIDVVSMTDQMVNVIVREPLGTE